MGQVLSFIRRLLRCSNVGSKVTDQTPTNDDPKKLTLPPQQKPAESHSVTIYDPLLQPSSVTAGGNDTNTNIATPTTVPACTVLDLSRVGEDDVENKARDEPGGVGVEDEDEKVVEIVVVVEEKSSKRKKQQKEFSSSSSSSTTAKSGVSVKTSTGEKVGRIGPYTTTHRILLVGEGDFSFSTSLAVAFGTASNMIATSLNSKEFLQKNYGMFSENKNKLVSRGCIVLHGVDATKMAQHPKLSTNKFDCIIYNFPHSGFRTNESANSEIGRHQKLVSGFFRNARRMIDNGGEIHVTHKSNEFFLKWNIAKLASDQSLYLIQEVKFKRSKYPGYHTKYGFGGDKDFDCNPSKTYKFGLASY